MDTKDFRQNQAVGGLYLGTPFRGHVHQVRPHSVRRDQVICRVYLETPTEFPFLGTTRLAISLSVGPDGKCPHHPERTFIRRECSK